MLPVPTLLAILHVHVTLDMQDMDGYVEVCIFSDTYNIFLPTLKEIMSIYYYTIDYFRHR